MTIDFECALGTTGLSNFYSPWDGFDYFGHDRLRDAINPHSPERRKVVTHASDGQPSSSKSSKEPHSSKGSDNVQLYYMYNCPINLSVYFEETFDISLFICIFVVSVFIVFAV